MNGTTESRLIREIYLDNATAYTAFVTGHLGLVFDLAREQYNGDGENMFQELVGEGKLALCEAARTFPQQHLDCKFSTYAYIRITRAMVSFRRTNGVVSSSEWSIRMQQKARQSWDKMVSFFQEQEGHAPTREQYSWVFGEKLEESLDVPQIVRDDNELSDNLYVSPPGEIYSPLQRTERGGYKNKPRSVRFWYDRPNILAHKFAQLPRDTRLVVGKLSEQYDSTDNISLSQIADSWHTTRQDLGDALVPFLKLAKNGQ